MTLEDMNANEVLVRYLNNMAEIERLDSENVQVRTTEGSIEEPRYVEDLSQWQEYRAAKEEITRLTEERVATNNEKKEALLKEQRDIQEVLLHSESVPKDKWIRCADDGVYVAGDPVNGEPNVRVALWQHVVETNGEPERLHEIRQEKASTMRGRMENALKNPNYRIVTIVMLFGLIILTLEGGGEGFALGISIIGVLVGWWYMETKKQLDEAEDKKHLRERNESLD